jgi:hypothetical protein
VSVYVVAYEVGSTCHSVTQSDRIGNECKWQTRRFSYTPLTHSKFNEYNRDKCDHCHYFSNDLWWNGILVEIGYRPHTRVVQRNNHIRAGYNPKQKCPAGLAALQVEVSALESSIYANLSLSISFNPVTGFSIQSPDFNPVIWLDCKYWLGLSMWLGEC